MSSTNASRTFWLRSMVQAVSHLRPRLLGPATQQRPPASRPWRGQPRGRAARVPSPAIPHARAPRAHASRAHSNTHPGVQRRMF